jgi:hypothetical protein
MAITAGTFSSGKGITEPGGNSKPGGHVNSKSSTRGSLHQIGRFSCKVSPNSFDVNALFAEHLIAFCRSARLRFNFVSRSHRNLSGLLGRFEPDLID